MAVDKRVRAPYNFIPLSDKILLPYDSVESLPAHDRIDPSLKTGGDLRNYGGGYAGIC